MDKIIEFVKIYPDIVKKNNEELVRNYLKKLGIEIDEIPYSSGAINWKDIYKRL